MSRFLSTALTILTSLTAIAAILAADPQGAADAAQGAASHNPALDAQTYHIAARIAYKESLIRELIAGRTTLARVSDEFLRLNEEEPTTMNVLRTSYPGSGDEERSAHNVLEYVHHLRLPAGEEDPLFTRLDREFADRFGHPPCGPVTP